MFLTRTLCASLMQYFLAPAGAMWLFGASLFVEVPTMVAKGAFRQVRLAVDGDNHTDVPLSVSKC
jgi:hypothetical protein